MVYFLYFRLFFKYILLLCPLNPKKETNMSKALYMTIESKLKNNQEFSKESINEMIERIKDSNQQKVPVVLRGPKLQHTRPIDALKVDLKQTVGFLKRDVNQEHGKIFATVDILETPCGTIINDMRKEMGDMEFYKRVKFIPRGLATLKNNVCTLKKLIAIDIVENLDIPHEKTKSQNLDI